MLHRQVTQGRELIAAYKRNDELRGRLIRSGEICMTFDEHYLILQHWRPAVLNFDGHYKPECRLTAPDGVTDGIGILTDPAADEKGQKIALTLYEMPRYGYIGG